MLKNIVPHNTKKNTHKKSKRKPKTIVTNEFIEHNSYNFVALVGYVILGLIFLDYIHLLIPPQLLNPNWELEVIGRIIESIWILLLGFMLVFFRTQQRQIKLKELKVLSFLSWVTLFVAIACFLAAPLLISNSIRISQTNKAQINAQLTNQNNQVETVLTQIDRASDREINTLVMKNQLKDLSTSSTQDVKKQLVDVVKQRQETANEQLKQSLKNKQFQLFKSTFKWTLGAIIAGITFVSVWKYTTWTRSIKV